MSPDAAEIFAQVDAALLIAIVVEAKAIPEPPESDVAHRKAASLYALALFCVLLSLAVTLTSVMYDKPLDAWASRVASTGTFMGGVAFYNQTFPELLKRAHGQRTNLRFLVVVMLAATVWFAIWAASFSPDVFIWNWF